MSKISNASWDETPDKPSDPVPEYDQFGQGDVTILVAHHLPGQKLAPDVCGMMTGLARLLDEAVKDTLLLGRVHKVLLDIINTRAKEKTE